MSSIKAGGQVQVATRMGHWDNTWPSRRDKHSAWLIKGQREPGFLPRPYSDRVALDTQGRSLVSREYWLLDGIQAAAI